ncbi:translocation and assembly module TamB [Natronocella acetinitrilica]|uniref:Translocation and assembly module TamB n=1 Tax=Natronocella acetinitrilica TaxID=414046 RepID=A0AAE3G6S0_9GAMM|nr:translocation/assembly module TamB domain-containing protein [Natronocella acetinitrilica]MCP1676079.1 translocation and assembly module TamB [Natronocella acetinitrilica]
MSWLRRIARYIGHGFYAVGWLTVKAFRFAYILLITLLAVLLWLVFTTSGAEWLANRAVSEEPRLSITVQGGSLWNGLEVSEVAWRDTGIDVSVDAARLRWNPLCLLALQVCVNEIHADGVAASVNTDLLRGEPDSASADEEPGDPMGRLSLPVRITLGDVHLDDVGVEVDGMRFGWRHFSGGADLRGDRLRVDGVRWVGPYGELPVTEPETELEVAVEEIIEGGDPPAFFPPGERDPIVLPDIPLPLDVAINDLRIRDARFRRGALDEQLARLDLTARLVGHDLRIDTLRAEHAMAAANLNGRLRLADEWPLDIDLHLQAHDVPEVGPVEVHLSAWNTVHEVDLDLRVEGPATVTAEGSVSPLEPLLAHDLTLNWRGLRWPLQGDAPEVASRAGEITVAGDLDGFDFDLALALSGAQLPEGDWQARGSGDWSRVRLDSLRGELLGGSLELSGEAGWWQTVDWDLLLSVDGLQPVQQWPDAPETVSGRVRAEGSLADGDLTLDAVLEDVQAAMQGYAVTAAGGVSHRPASGWRVDDLGLRSGDNRIVVNGRASEETLDLAADINLDDLGMFLPDAAGAIRGRINARGPLLEPDIEADLTATTLRYQELVALDELTLVAELTRLALGDSRLRIDMAGLETEQADARVDSLALRLDGTRGRHRLSLEVDGEPAGLDLVLQGGLDEDTMIWTGELAQLGLLAEAHGLGLDLEDPASLEVDINGQRAALGPHCWLPNDGRLCAEEPLELAESGSARFRLEGHQLASLSTWLPDEIRLLGELNGEFGAEWEPQRLPRVDASFSVTGGRVLAKDEEEDEFVEFEYETLEASLILDDDSLRTHLELVSSGIGAAALDAEISVVDGALADLNGSVSLSGLNLAVAEPFFLELRQLRGEINAEGQLSGTLQDPRFDGELRLVDGTVETLAVPVTISEIELLVEVAGDNATLSGGFRSGGGTAELSGDADWSSPDWSATVNLVGRRLELAYDTIALIEASPDLTLSLRPQAADLSGEIRIPRGDITVQSLPEGAVRVSGDVVIIEDGEEEGDEQAELFDPDAIPVADGWVVTSNIEIILGNRVNISAFGLNGRLEGQLGVVQAETGAPQAAGEIRIADGEYRAYGQRLQIREGQILFSGPLDRPQLYVEAVRTINRPEGQTVVAGLRIEGPPDDPRVSLFSEPMMEEDMILSYIILGRPLGEEGPGSEQMVARAAIALGIAGGGGIAGGIAEDLGIQDFELDTEGDGDDTQFVVRGRLSPNLYVSYGVGVFQAENTLKLRYRLTQRLFLEAVSGLENALDLLYTFEF